MSRVVDNKKILEAINRTTESLQDSDMDAFQVMNVNLTAAALILGDMSQSMAVIADAMEKENGWWIVQNDDRFVKCNKCGMRTTRNELRGIAIFGEDQPNYCPKCGAHMIDIKREERDAKRGDRKAETV